MTSSAMRLASRPTRVASRDTVPWNRVGRAAFGGSVGVVPGSGPTPGVGLVPPPGIAGCGLEGSPLSASSCRRATSGLTSNSGPSASVNDTTCPPRSPRYRFASSSKLSASAKASCSQVRRADSVAHRLQEHRGGGDAREIEIAREVLDDLLDGDVVAAPQRDAIELHPQAGGGEAGHQQLITLQLLARSGRQRILARQPHGQPLDRSDSGRV